MFIFLFRKGELRDDATWKEGGKWIKFWEREYLFRRPALLAVVLFDCRLRSYVPKRYLPPDRDH